MSILHWVGWTFAWQALLVFVMRHHMGWIFLIITDGLSLLSCRATAGQYADCARGTTGMKTACRRANRIANIGASSFCYAHTAFESQRGLVHVFLPASVYWHITAEGGCYTGQIQVFHSHKWNEGNNLSSMWRTTKLVSSSCYVWALMPTVAVHQWWTCFCSTIEVFLQII